jgi:endonuclease/exonuclease/phosphatase family metal-dependent hydrolase
VGRQSAGRQSAGIAPQPPHAPSSQSQADSLSIHSLNIAHGRGTKAHQLFLPRGTIEKNLLTVANLIRGRTPDLIALQEVDQHSFWNGNFDQSTFLARNIPMQQSVHGCHMDTLKLAYGTSILSNLQLQNTLSATFPAKRLLPRKGFVCAQALWPNDSHFHFDIASIHLDFARKKTRRRQADLLIELLQQRKLPLVLCGDFNCEWSDRNSAVAYIADQLKLKAFQTEAKNLGSFRRIWKRWDWILISQEFQFATFKVFQEPISDHCLLETVLVRR